MKVSDLRRKLLATLVAGGLLAPGVASAANLNANLLLNPGFEGTNFDTVTATFAPILLDWTNPGFAYSHDGSGGAPDFANGDPLPPETGGSFYFYPGGNIAMTNPPHESLETAMTQTIDLSTGATGTLIPTGNAAVALSGFFNSFETQTDHGIVQVDFLNAGNAVLGSTQLTPGDVPLEQWTKFNKAASIPVGTTKVKVSAWGTAQVGRSDGYMDELNVQVTNPLRVTVDRASGVLTLSNPTGAAVNISGYSIISAFESLKPATWLSIADNYDSGNPGPNQVDPAHAWTEQTDPNSHGDLTESDPSAAGASLANSRTVNLGGAWIPSYFEDLVFSYTTGGQVQFAPVAYTGGPGGQPLREGDLNIDGAINAADWIIVRSNQFANLSTFSLAEAYRVGDFNGDLRNDHADFVAFKTLFDAANGAGSFAAMAGSVPEPSTIILAGAAGVFVAAARRRARRS